MLFLKKRRLVFRGASFPFSIVVEGKRGQAGMYGMVIVVVVVVVGTLEEVDPFLLIDDSQYE